MISWATLSDCGRYRYALGRVWNEALPVLVYVMLNPSTADADFDDPTIRKCIGFAERNGCGGILVVNLWAWRSTDPDGLRSSPDPIGPENLETLHYFAHTAAATGSRVIVAWGANAAKLPWQRSHAEWVLKRLRTEGDVFALRATKGVPHHPLMLPYALRPELFKPRLSMEAA